MHTRIPRSNTSIKLGRTHRRHHGTIVANEIARSQPHWRCVREVAGKRNTRGTSLCLLSRNGIVRTSRSARTPRSSTNTSRLTEILRRFPALPCYAPSSPPSFSFFTYLTLHSRDPYTPNKGGHTDVNIYIYIYTNCVSPWPSSKHCLTLTLATRQRATKSRCTSSSFSSSTWIRRTITKRVTFFFFTVPKLTVERHRSEH